MAGSTLARGRKVVRSRPLRDIPLPPQKEALRGSACDHTRRRPQPPPQPGAVLLRITGEGKSSVSHRKTKCTRHCAERMAQARGGLEVKLSKAVALLPEAELHWATSADSAGVQVLSETCIFVLDLRVDDDELDMSS